MVLFGNYFKNVFDIDCFLIESYSTVYSMDNATTKLIIFVRYVQYLCTSIVINCKSEALSKSVPSTTTSFPVRTVKRNNLTLGNSRLSCHRNNERTFIIIIVLWYRNRLIRPKLSTRHLSACSLYILVLDKTLKSFDAQKL